MRSTCRQRMQKPGDVSTHYATDAILCNTAEDGSAQTTAHLLSAATRASQKARMTDRSCSSTLLSSSFLQNSAGRQHRVMLWKIIRWQNAWKAQATITQSQVMVVDRCVDISINLAPP